MKKIRITITMTEQEAEWLEQACFVEEEFPHSKFLNHISNLARRARHTFQQLRAVGCAYCHCTTVILRDGVHCINCGRMYKSHIH